MTHQAPPPSVAPGADPGRQVAQLREALRLVEQISGRGGEAGGDAGSDGALDEAALVSDSYDRALPIAQRRFDTLAGETAVWATAGVEALLAAGAAAPPRAAAARLAAQLDRALSDLKALIGQ